MCSIVFDSPCIRKGQEATTEIVARYSDDYPGHLPMLVILGNWRVKLGTYATHDVYDCEEIDSPLGRAFLLHRTKEAVAADPDHTERYGVLIANPQDCLCECKGFEAHGRCKHVAALSALLAAGKIDHPLADAPSSPWPHPEQLTDPWAADTVVTLTPAGHVATTLANRLDETRDALGCLLAAPELAGTDNTNTIADMQRAEAAMAVAPY